MSETSSSTNTLQYPHPDTLQSAVKLAIIQDKPILMDYYQASLNKTDNCVLIGVRENKERLLVKSEEEYTSLISNVYKCNNMANLYITIKQAANILGVSTLTLRNWDRRGKLTAFRHPLNNYRVYKRSDIEALIAEISSNTSPVETKPRKVAKKLSIRHL
jgi:DNA (cytosine-5)-methyltransferase 1